MHFVDETNYSHPLTNNPYPFDQEAPDTVSPPVNLPTGQQLTGNIESEAQEPKPEVVFCFPGANLFNKNT